MAASNTASLATLISTIPVAVEGDLITSDYHNSLRSVVLALVDILGPGAVQRTFTFAPTFFKNGALVEWRFTNGVASAPAHQSNTVSGIIPVQLPNGAAIKSLIIRGRKQGTVGGLEAKLVRQALAGSISSSLISVPMEEVTTDNQGFFRESRDITVLLTLAVGAAASNVILEDLRTVDTEQYKYYVSADADGVENLVEIHTIQIECSQ